MAAFDGIINKIDPRKEGYGPFDFNLYSLSEEKKLQIESLPENLLEAAKALEDDYEYLLAGDVFSKNLISNHIKKIKEEHYLVNKMPHPLEFEMYYDL